MYKYNGLLIHQSHDDEGVLEVVERSGVRSLHFGTPPRQSSMRLSEPYNLELVYARAMSSWLLFKEQPKNILLIGLGGGSLAKHILHHISDCHIDAVEYRNSVVKIARSHFGLPFDNRLKIIIGDGTHYVYTHQESHQQTYDLILIDAFDHEGVADGVCSESFFKNCYNLLKPDGMFVANLWADKNQIFQNCSKWLSDIYQWRVLFLPVQGRSNIITLCYNHALPPILSKSLRQRAMELERYYHIEFPLFLKDLFKYNASNLNYIIKL